MLLSSIAVMALMSTRPGINPAPTVVPSAGLVRGDHGKLDWFEGSFEKLLQKAKVSNKLVFLDFWTSW